MRKLVLLLVFFCSSCTTPFNEGVEDSFTEEGCLVEKDQIQKPEPYQVNFFLETSGSMAGLMPPGKGTEFQTNLWDLIALLNEAPQQPLQMFQLRSRNEAPSPLTLTSLRTALNTGKFEFGRDTDIPEMVDSILIRTKPNTVSVLVSDLIFSPVGNSQALQAQFTTDIRTRFAKKHLGSAILQFYSDFHYQKSNEVEANSPYYVWIIGAPEMVKDLTQKIKGQLKVNNEITHGLGTISAPYSILPYAVSNASSVPNFCASDQRYYCLTEWDGQTSDTELAVAIDLKGLPLHTNLTHAFTQLATMANVSLRQVETSANLKTEDDRIWSEISATHVLRLKITGLSQESNLITLNFKDEKPDWVEKLDHYNGGSRKGTQGLDALVEGLEKALPRKRALLARPIRLLITKRTY